MMRSEPKSQNIKLKQETIVSCFSRFLKTSLKSRLGWNTHRFMYGQILAGQGQRAELFLRVYSGVCSVWREKQRMGFGYGLGPQSWVLLWGV